MYPSYSFLILFFFCLVSLSGSTSTLCGFPLPLPLGTSPSSFPSQLFIISSSSFLDSKSQVVTFNFVPKSALQTNTPGLTRLRGNLTVHGMSYGAPSNRSLFHGTQHNLPLLRQVSISFELDGFWFQPDSLVCMSGHGFILPPLDINIFHPRALFKINFSKRANISFPFYTSTLDSLDEPINPNYFDAISIVTYSRTNYDFTRIAQAKDSCSHLKINEESRGFNRNFPCQQLHNSLLKIRYKLEYGVICSNGDCLPTRGIVGLDQDFMLFDQVNCIEDGKVGVSLIFSNKSKISYRNSMVKKNMLVAEGIWDPKENRLCLVGCSALWTKSNSIENISINDCSFRLSLWFPSAWSIKKRRISVGRIWKEKNKGYIGNLSTISFSSMTRSIGNSMGWEVYRKQFVGLKYEYAKLDAVRGFCPNISKLEEGHERYPDGRSFRDLTFQFSMTSKKAHFFGSASPIMLGQKFFIQKVLDHEATYMDFGNKNLQNVSFKIEIKLSTQSKILEKPTSISAEGIYNSLSGSLCLVGCRFIGLLNISKQARVNDSLDCHIFINVQFGPINEKSKEHVKGSILSNREESDPLFFDPIEISSYGTYIEPAAKLIRRMDIEIIMIILSITLNCIFFSFQLNHVKRNPNFLPTTSIITLGILAWGYMIPFFVNPFAQRFERHSKGVFLWSPRLFEVSEVIIIILTAPAFLLQVRLLQLAWITQSDDVNKTSLWDSEKRTSTVCFPLYIVGAVISYILYKRKNNMGQYTSLEAVRSCSGLLVDGFLLPQVFFNIFLDSKEKNLARSFYIGCTFLRVLPHVYDVYRVRNYESYNTRWLYVYASPSESIYTLEWDIVVIFGGLMLSVLIFLQQSFGGAFFLPESLKKWIQGSFNLLRVKKMY